MMMRHEELLNTWFDLLLPRGQSFNDFEQAEGFDDRQKTRQVLELMERELPRTFENVLGVSTFEYSPSVLRMIDASLTRNRVAAWMQAANHNSNNFLKLTLSELAAYLGGLFIRTRGGGWKYARFPNDFQSSIVVDDISFHVFDTVIKRCSENYGLVSKFDIFQRIGATSKTVS